MDLTYAPIEAAYFMIDCVLAYLIVFNPSSPCIVNCTYWIDSL